MSENNQDSNVAPIARDAYELIAEGFSKLAPTKAENAYIEQPAMRKAIGEKIRGLKILEIGCGPGILAEYLTHEGAKVVGFDVSFKMIELAKERVKNNATFFVADMAKPLPLSNEYNNQFDLAVASLSIDYVKDWSMPLSEIKRLLKKDSRFIFTIQHPVGSWNWYRPECAFGVQYVESDWKGFSKNPVAMPDYYRSISEVINPLIKSGFMILEIEECRPIEALKHVDPFKFKKFNMLPSFMRITVQSI